MEEFSKMQVRLLLLRVRIACGIPQGYFIIMRSCLTPRHNIGMR